MIEIQLTRGKIAVIDTEDLDLISKYKWHVLKDKYTFYAMATIPGIKSRQTALLMHRLIINTPSDMIVDHINGNGLDNRKINLRVVSNSQNSQNRRIRRDSQTGYKGVQKRGDKWRTRIYVEGKRKHLGYFDNKIDAALAYDKAARAEFGEFAKMNFEES